MHVHSLGHMEGSGMRPSEYARILLALAAMACFGTVSAESFSLSQLGPEFKGEAVGDRAQSVSLSANGQRLVLGALNNDDNGADAGHTRVFEWTGASLEQLGSAIEGEAAGDHSGHVVALSGDGARLAIGARNNDGGGADSGHVRVFEWTGAVWAQLGSDIDGDPGDQLGRSVDLSHDGSRLAVGSRYSDGNGVDSGQAQVYEWSGADWEQVGSAIVGESSGDELTEVALSDDGGRLAAGAYLNDGNGEDSGHTRMFEWSGLTWDQLGSDIDGENPGDNSGNSVALSSDGSRVAIGERFNADNGAEAGQVRVFEWSGSAWLQLGKDIEGEAAGDRLTAVSLSSDGALLVVGASLNDSNGTDSGQVRVFKWSGATWHQVGPGLLGENSGDEFGRRVAISGNGERIAAGAPSNDGNGEDSGHARVFSLFDITRPVFRDGFEQPLNTVTKVDDGGDVGEYTSATIGLDGLPVVSYYDRINDALKVTKCNDPMCAGNDESISFVDDPANNVGQHTSLAIGTDGNPVISYFDVTTETIRVAKCNDAACAGSDETITDLAVPGFRSSIAIGSDGYPVISYFDRNTLGLSVIKCNDMACTGNDKTISVVDDPGDEVGQYNALVIGLDAMPMIAYNNSDSGTLMFVKCNDSACAGSDETPVSLDGPTGVINGMEHISMALDSSGLPVVSYYPGDGVLKIAKCNDSACTGGDESVSIVDIGTGSVGSHTALAISSDDLPIIAYQDISNLALKVAMCNDPACTGGDEQISTVDNTQGWTGTENSILIGADGLPLVLYHSQTAWGLWALRCGLESCMPY